MCYMAHGGIVLGAASTSSVFTPGIPQQGLLGVHYLNHNQKLFELGENSSVGVLTWGLGSLSLASYRTLLSLVADSLKTSPPKDVKDIADRWSHPFWKDYQADPGVQLCKTLDAKGAPDPAKPTTRTKDEEQAFQSLKRNLVAGFCIAGYCSDLPVSTTRR